jgi:hypothetical protein
VAATQSAKKFPSGGGVAGVSLTGWSRTPTNPALGRTLLIQTNKINSKKSELLTRLNRELQPFSFSKKGSKT